MDMKSVGKWSYLVGIGVAIVAALAGFSPSWLALVLAILGILAGLFEADTDKVVDYGIRYLTLVVLAGALNEFPVVGSYITTIAGAMLGFFGPIILTVLLAFNYKQTMALMKD